MNRPTLTLKVSKPADLEAPAAAVLSHNVLAVFARRVQEPRSPLALVASQRDEPLAVGDDSDA